MKWLICIAPSIAIPTKKQNIVQLEKIRLSSDKSFIIDLNCCAFNQCLPDKHCQIAKQALESAGNRIAQMLVITKPITVKATFAPFCAPDDKQCTKSNSLGGAVYGASFIGTRPNDAQFVVFPQALVKQLPKSDRLVYTEPDIIARFNSDYPFYFRNNSQIMNKSLYDFEYGAVHELTHGLGFGSGLIQYSSLYNFPISGFLAPNIYTRGKQQDIYSLFNPIDCFDSFITGTHRFEELGKSMVNFPKQSSSLSDFIDKFQKSDNIEYAKKAYQESRRGQNTLHFKTIDGDKIALFSPIQFQQGSSISHVDEQNINTAEFLMVPNLSPGLKLESMMKKSNSKKVYGPRTLGIMKSIGWQISDQEQVLNITITTNFETLGNYINASAIGNDFWSVICLSTFLVLVQ
jgi:hypothetical protein